MELSNPKQEKFAQLAAQGLTQAEAARRAGYGARGAANMGSRLARSLVVRNRIDELKNAQGVLMQSVSGIRNPQSRVTALEDRWNRLRTIITERGADPDMQSVPGGKTGLLVVTFKQLGGGENAQIVREYRVDTELLKEIRATEQQAAEELGQWTTRKETYNQSLNVSLTDKKSLQEQIKAQLSILPKREREQIMIEAPGALIEAITGNVVDAEYAEG